MRSTRSHGAEGDGGDEDSDNSDTQVEESPEELLQLQKDQSFSTKAKTIEDENISEGKEETKLIPTPEKNIAFKMLENTEKVKFSQPKEDLPFDSDDDEVERSKAVMIAESAPRMSISDKPDVPVDAEYPSDYPASFGASTDEVDESAIVTIDASIKLSDSINKIYDHQLTPSQPLLDVKELPQEFTCSLAAKPQQQQPATESQFPRPHKVKSETDELPEKDSVKPEYPAIKDLPLKRSDTSFADIEHLTLPGPSSFLGFGQPPDETDEYTLPDSIDTNIEISCPLTVTGNVFEGDDEDMASNKKALSLVKCYGQENKVPVLSLSQGDHLAILYACSHTGVVYDVDSKQQYLLQGHSNGISCLTTSYDKNWVVVADKGPKSVVNVWHVSVHTKQMTPIRTFFNFQQAGISAVAMSQSGTLVAVITADNNQNLSIWNWTDSNESPIVSMDIDEKYGYQNYLLFNPDDQSQLVSNSESHVIFYSWSETHIKHFAPPITHFDIAKQVGKFSATVFFKNSSNALTATGLGKFLAWEKFRPMTLENMTPFKRVHKIVRMQNKGITVLTTTNNFIVTGDTLGHIKFYDETLKLVNWFKDVNLGPINSISFDFDPEVKNDEMMAYGKENEFEIQNFIFGTEHAKFVYVTANGLKYDIVNEDFECPVVAMDVHPVKPLIALGGENGLVRIFQYQTGNAVASKVFDGGKVSVTCVAYSVEGSMIAIGFASGKVEVLHGLNLQPFCKQSLTDTVDAITHISFASNFDFMATADKGFAVTVYSILKEKVWIDDGLNFKFFGRFRAHNKAIRSIMFKCIPKANAVEFYSLGLDRYLVEYNLYNPGGGVSVKSRNRLEQFAVPLCMWPYPRFNKEPFLLVCNDQFKFKLFNVNTRFCRKTILGPTYGIPVQKFLVSSCKGKGSSQKYFIAYMLDDKIGISLLLMTGNPHQSFTMISHPLGVQNIAISYDGKYMFSIGGKSASLLMWSVNLVALEVQAELGGQHLAPFYDQIEGGKDGQFMYELQNVFYFAQIQNQGISTAEKRHVGVTIPLSEISSIMRVLGFFPTEREVLDMVSEIKYEKYIETGELIENIDVESFLRLYVNHKPVKCEQSQMLKWAFDVVGNPVTRGEKSVDKEAFLKFLMEHGEPMSENELAECMAAISGITINANVCQPSADNITIDTMLPDKVTASKFSRMLGFDKV